MDFKSYKQANKVEKLISNKSSNDIPCITTFKQRLDKLVLKGNITKKRREELANEFRAALSNGELGAAWNLAALTDAELMAD